MNIEVNFSLILGKTSVPGETWSERSSDTASADSLIFTTRSTGTRTCEKNTFPLHFTGTEVTFSMRTKGKIACGQRVRKHCTKESVNEI